MLVWFAPPPPSKLRGNRAAESLRLLNVRRELSQQTLLFIPRCSSSSLIFLYLLIVYFIDSYESVSSRLEEAKELRRQQQLVTTSHEKNKNDHHHQQHQATATTTILTASLTGILYIVMIAAIVSIVMKAAAARKKKSSAVRQHHHTKSVKKKQLQQRCYKHTSSKTSGSNKKKNSNKKRQASTASSSFTSRGPHRMPHVAVTSSKTKKQKIKTPYRLPSSSSSTQKPTTSEKKILATSQGDKDLAMVTLGSTVTPQLRVEAPYQLAVSSVSAVDLFNSRTGQAGLDALCVVPTTSGELCPSRDNKRKWTPTSDLLLAGAIQSDEIVVSPPRKKLRPSPPEEEESLLVSTTTTSRPVTPTPLSSYGQQDGFTIGQYDAKKKSPLRNVVKKKRKRKKRGGGVAAGYMHQIDLKQFPPSRLTKKVAFTVDRDLSQQKFVFGSGNCQVESDLGRMFSVGSRVAVNENKRIGSVVGWDGQDLRVLLDGEATEVRVLSTQCVIMIEDKPVVSKKVKHDENPPNGNAEMDTKDVGEEDAPSVSQHNATVPERSRPKEERIVGMKKMKAFIEENGWFLDRLNKHYVYKRHAISTTDGSRVLQTMTLAHTPSDWRCWKNILSGLRRKNVGFIVDPDYHHAGAGTSSTSASSRFSIDGSSLQCFICGVFKLQNEYSKTQWKKPEKNKCIVCVSDAESGDDKKYV